MPMYMLKAKDDRIFDGDHDEGDADDRNNNMSKE